MYIVYTLNFNPHFKQLMEVCSETFKCVSDGGAVCYGAGRERHSW